MKKILTLVVLALFSVYTDAKNPFENTREMGMIQGIVFSDIDQSPIEEATVSIDGFKTQTDAKGQFFLDQIPVGKYLLIVNKKGFKPKIYPLSIVVEKKPELRISMTINALQLPELLIKSDRGTSAASSLVLNTLDFQLRPINSAQDMLRNVSGLVTAQHAGGGKAEQIFLRGFDADHGTDVAAFVDGMPVNMPSHGHGQGYLDLHFLIPETVKNIEVSKGTYAAELGDFATAGAVKFKTLDVLEQNIAQVEATTVPTQRGFTGSRGLLMYQLAQPNNNAKGVSSYVASEYIFAPSYFEAPQNFNRLNIFSKNKIALSDKSNISLSLSHFNSKWDASGQIPDRAVVSGAITRFGSIDNTEGGNTSRQNINLTHTYFIKNQSLETQLYYSKYDFNLYSNFTFFKNDSINGDMIQQQDNRYIMGLNTKYVYDLGKSKWIIGGGMRHDDIDNNLAQSPKKVFETYLASSNIKETNSYMYAKNQYALTSKLFAELGLRFNYFNFDVVDLLPTTANHQNYTGKNHQTLLSPKLNLTYSFSNDYKLFLNAGQGFHSNDARAVVQDQIGNRLPAAWGGEVGFQVRPIKNILLNAAIWGLSLDNELVFIGDEGTTEDNGASRRIGLDIGLRASVMDWLFFDADVNLSKGRFTENSFGKILAENNLIPLAPNITATGGLTWRFPIGIEGAARYRYVGDRAANENNSVMAKGYGLVDINCFYRKNQYKIGFSIENLLNTAWNEAQFDTESKMRNEAVSVSELHYTPGTPFAAKMTAGIVF
jgi:outer membrane receptor protein involved in Fe transport